MSRATTLFAVLMLGAAPVMAQQAQDHAMGSHGTMAAPTDPASSTAAYTAAMDRMHDDMAIDYTGDADVDFAKGMIPHHQGAIDMAKILLEHGDDPELRKMAEEIIAAQQAEIAQLQDWLKSKGE